MRILEDDDEADKFRLIISDAPNEYGNIDANNTKIICLQLQKILLNSQKHLTALDLGHDSY